MTTMFGSMFTAAAVALEQLGATVPVTVTIASHHVLTPILLVATNENSDPAQGEALVARAAEAWRVGIRGGDETRMCETKVDGVGVCAMTAPMAASTAPETPAARVTGTAGHAALLRQLVDWAEALPGEAIANVSVDDDGADYAGHIAPRRGQSQRVCEAVAITIAPGIAGSYGEGVLPTGHRLGIHE